MAITYTTAAERDVRRAHHRRWSVAGLDPALTGASVLAALLDVRRLPGGLCDLADGRHRGADRQPEHRGRCADPRDRLRAGPADARRSAAGRPGVVVVPGAARRRAPDCSQRRGDRPNTRAGSHDRSRPDRGRVSRSPARRACPRGCRGDGRSALGVTADLRAACGDQAVRDRPGPRIGPAPAPHLGRALSHRLPRGVCGVAVARASRRSRPARGRPRADGSGLRRDGQPAGSAARSAPVRALCRGRAGGLDGRRRRVVFQPANRQPAKPQLSAASRRVRAVVSAPRPRNRIGAVREQREGESRSVPAHRSDPDSAGALSRRILRAPLGAPARGPQRRPR